jgi:hypothetical protein
MFGQFHDIQISAAAKKVYCFNSYRCGHNFFL